MRNVKPKTDEYMSPSPMGLKKGKSAPVYPCVRLDLDTVPEAKSWKVGETYILEMEVKMVGLSQSRHDNSAEFEIHKIGTDNDDTTSDKE